jgi:methylenetetrahydrofolate reductase (NADPH)
MALFSKTPKTIESPEAAIHRRQLIEHLNFELVPMKNLDSAQAALPVGATVSMTCSPVKGISETQHLTEDLIGQGFDVVPHIAARMVRDRVHTKELAGWFRDVGVKRVFIVAGDAEVPGDYFDAVLFLSGLLDTDHGLTAIGVTAYPDGHSYISNDDLSRALHAKQQLLDDAGIPGWCSTQMCFDPSTIETWLRAERAAGLTMPVHLGISGVVDKTKLITMGARLGIGQSLNYFKKNKAAIAKMLTSPAYDPNDLLVPLSQASLDLGVEGVHMFTFNQVAATEAWRQENL